MLPPLVHLHRGALDGQGPDDEVALPDDALHHLVKVLRARPGTEVVVADGAGASAPGQLTAGGVRLAELPRIAPAPSPAIEVVHGLPKGRKLDEVVRVLTELGVDRVRPVHAERSPVELRGPRAEKARARWEAVARSAAGQSRRVHLPAIDAPADLAEILPGLVDSEQAIGVMAHPESTSGLGEFVRSDPGGQPVAERARIVVAVGPESGWSGTEVAAWEAAGGHHVHLGPTVLRTEHAAAAVCAALALALGRMG